VALTTHHLWACLFLSRPIGKPWRTSHGDTYRHYQSRPVLTFWAAVVAERLGYDYETALTLGKAVAGIKARSKARQFGIVDE
jgi:hypothetical protein